MRVPETQHLDLLVSILFIPMPFNAIFQPMILKFYISTKAYPSAHLAVSFVGLNISDIYDQSNSWFFILANK